MDVIEEKNSGISEELDEYAKAWYDKMTEIWRDRIELLGIFDTGRLVKEVKNTAYKVNQSDFEMEFEFVKYGIYVDAGTGNGYYKGNPGDLKFLDRGYRYKHKLGKARVPRPWFSVSWFISVEILKEKTAHIMGDKFVGLFDNL